jgi:DNA-binding CsgD family transcriptional regulator
MTHVQDREHRLHAVMRQLGTLTFGDPALSTEALAGVAGMLEADLVVMYGFSPTLAGLTLTRYQDSAGSRFREALAPLLSTSRSEVGHEVRRCLALGSLHEMELQLDERPHSWVRLAVFRSQALLPEDRDALLALVPVLRWRLELDRAIRRGIGRVEEALAAVLGHFGQPALALEVSGAIVAMNPAAAGWLAADDGAKAAALTDVTHNDEAGPFMLLNPAGTVKVLVQQPLEAALDRCRELWRLTTAETRVLPRVVEGATYAQIAEVLGLSVKTVKHQVQRLLERSGAGSRHELREMFWSTIRHPR